MMDNKFYLVLMIALAASTLFCLYITPTDIMMQVRNSRKLNMMVKLNNTSWNMTSKGQQDDDVIVEQPPEHMHHTEFIFQPVIDFNTTCDISCDIRNDFNWTMVTFIKSTAGNYLRRQFIRRTWGGIRYTSTGRFLFIFVTGEPTSNVTFALVEEEKNRYQDILMYKGPDNYRNIARKTLAGMQWASVNLPSEYYYSTADDDFLLDMAVFEDMVNENIDLVSKHNWPCFPFVCTYKVLPYPKVVRDVNYKAYVPVTEYKWPEFPRGCLGGFYTSKVDFISRVWQFCAHETMVRMDDVWITGIIRQKMGVPEYAVIQPRKSAASHYSGFRNKGDPRSKTFMLNEWNGAYRSISERPHCVCQ